MASTGTGSSEHVSDGSAVVAGVETAKQPLDLVETTVDKIPDVCKTR